MNHHQKHNKMLKTYADMSFKSPRQEKVLQVCTFLVYQYQTKIANVECHTND